MANTFALDVSKFVKKAPELARVVVRKVAGETLHNVVMRTPVGNPDLWKGPAPAGYVGGRLRANWVTSHTSPDSGTTTTTDEAGNATIARGQATIQGAPDGAPIFIMNNLPYAIPVEYGHSHRQAPRGMVRITVVEFQKYVDAAVKSLPK